jgi:ACS family tartrate transporter-like MFS transporter
MQSLEVEEAASARLRRSLDVRIVPWAFCIGLISYLDRTNLAFASIQLSRDLGFSCGTYGLASGLFFIGYGLFQVPSVSMFHRFGVPWLVCTIVVWGAVAASFALVRSSRTFFVLRIVLGALESGTYPIILAWLSTFYSERALGTAYASAATSTALATVVGSPIAATILLLDGVLGIAGWQWLFLVEGCVSVTFGMYVYCFMPRQIEDVLSGDEIRALHGENRSTSTGSTLKSHHDRLLAVLRSWRPHFLGIVFGLVMVSMYGCVFFIPLFIASFLAADTTSSVYGDVERSNACSSEEHTDTPNTVVVLLSAIPFASAAVAMVLVGKSSERLRERRFHAAIPVLLGSILMISLAVSMTLRAPATVNLVLLTLSAAAIWAFHAPFVSWPYEFFDKELASTCFAVINSWGALGGFLGPSMLGLLAEVTNSYALSLSILAAVLGVAAVMIYAFRLPTKSLDAERLLNDVSVE